MVSEVHDCILIRNTTCQSVHMGRLNLESISKARNSFTEEYQNAYTSPPVLVGCFFDFSLLPHIGNLCQSKINASYQHSLVCFAQAYRLYKKSIRELKEQTPCTPQTEKGIYTFDSKVCVQEQKYDSTPKNYECLKKPPS